jgi:hypothetical protein
MTLPSLLSSVVFAFHYFGVGNEPSVCLNNPTYHLNRFCRLGGSGRLVSMDTEKERAVLLLFFQPSQALFKRQWWLPTKVF